MHVRPFIPDEDEFRACYSSCYSCFRSARVIADAEGDTEKGGPFRVRKQQRI